MPIDESEFQELLDSDLMITKKEQRQRRIVFGTIAAAGLVATVAVPFGIRGFYLSSAMLLETAIGSNF
jgi:hypothetical protein